MEPGTSREAQARSGCPTAVCRHHDSPAAAAAEAGEKAAQCGQAGGAERRKESEEELDPRIQDELEHLNQASDDINKLELQLDDARSSYRRILTDSARKLNAQGSQLGACIEKARPYYEARRLAKEVNEAEEERLCSEQEHQRVTLLCQDAEARVQTLQKSLRKAILKSKPYFELKAQFNHILEEHKAKVLQLEEQVSKVKTRYFVALRNLEQISEQIHAQRAQSVAPEGRSSPVGAEAEVQGAAAAPVSTCVGVSGIESAWAGGEKTRLWVERHRESGWGQRERLEAEPATVVSLQTTASDLEKCDSLEHLGDLGDGGSELGEEWGCHQNRPLSRGIMTGGSQLDKGGVCEEMQDSLIKQHQRSFSL
ncbi:SH3 domain-binding protein 5-like isoform X2 [Austrofundulus limnaeus]|uniref:SH3 domain-binding protein 5 n=1 Tax=Austrofundulus limnaeus TaxID=52670 RepID=A0A2I4CQE4_AUSLI|nr:PREDICTED: SH3 domain-binding protein 5-like isoform X2 [Austrofundulus limnaeus]